MLVQHFIEHYPHTLAHDLEVKVMDLEILCQSFASKILRSNRQAQVQAGCPI